MIELPHPDFGGADDSERLQKVLRYLDGLHAALEVKFSNIDTQDLNAATAAQLQGGGAQDLSAYATRAALEAAIGDLRGWVQEQDYATGHDVEEAIGTVTDYVDDQNYAPKSYVDDAIDDHVRQYHSS
ncbi:MAG: hypothetical protein IK080_01850 [Clostridia bacterium]|nr:hypothetical protein [Clostridia bacterium]